MSLPRLLIVDDNAEYLQSLQRALRRDFSVTLGSSVEEGRKALGARVDLVLLDIRLDDQDETNQAGINLLREFQEARPDLPVVMMTAYDNIDIAVEAMRIGAADFIRKGQVDLLEIRKVLHNVLDKARLERRLIGVEEDLRRIEPGELVGQHPSLEEVRRGIDIVARDGQATVLIQGETGTGKELVARAIHSQGMRRRGPFIPAALPASNPNLIETDLFGHERGAFTDARGERAGFIEKAEGGVLFLDEIGELPLELQPKLLRFLDQKTYYRVGSSEETPANVQVVLATNRDLEKAVENNQFREDLYFRLKTFEIHLSPLRQRIDDIPLLIDHFLRLFREQGRTHIAEVQQEARFCLMNYPWPGNIRELKSALERALMYANAAGRREIDVEDLPWDVRGKQANASLVFRVAIPDEGLDIYRELARTELTYLEAALHRAEGRKTLAWKYLGLNDRFALRRRAQSLISEYPDLARQFPSVWKAYFGD